MLVKHNLTTHSAFKEGTIRNHETSVYINYLDGNVVQIKKKKEAEWGHIYVSLFDHIEVDEMVVFSGKLNLLSGGEIFCYFNGFNAKPVHISSKGITKIESTGKKNKAYNQVQLRLYSDDEIVFKFTELKLEKGKEATIYLPHKSNLPQDKQPLLPPEGNYKEIQPQ